jgi:hypothetical protein
MIKLKAIRVFILLSISLYVAINFYDMPFSKTKTGKETPLVSIDEKRSSAFLSHYFNKGTRQFDWKDASYSPAGYGSGGSSQPPIVVAQNFNGTSLDQEANVFQLINWPPDTMAQAGPNQILQAVNQSIWVWSKNGALLADYNSRTFFGALSGWTVSDPQIRYDPISTRWFVSAMAFTTPLPSQGGYVYLAVSQTSDATSAWNVYIVSSNNSALIYDQPFLGITLDKVILSWDDYQSNFNPINFKGQETWVIQKSDLLSGSSNPQMVSLMGSPDATRSRLTPATETPEVSNGYIVFSASCCNPTAIEFITVVGTPANSNVSFQQVSISINSMTVPPAADQPGLPASLDTGDNRIISAVYSNGILWAAANDGCTPSSDTSVRSCARLFDLTVPSSGSPSLLQDFDAGISGDDLMYPALALDPNGNLFVSFSMSSSSLYASSYVAVQPNGSALNSISPPVLLQAGSAIYNNNQGSCGGSGTTPSRWGDYSSASLDPQNPTDVWVASEYAATSSIAQTNGCAWGTNISEVYLPIPEPYHPISPTRICDTRSTSAANQCSGKTLGPGENLSVQAGGLFGVPSSGVTAVVMNVTVTNTTSSSYMTLFPAGTSPPLASNLNWQKGETIPNLVTTSLGSADSIEAYNFAGSVDLIIDLEGYYGPSSNSAGLFNPISPTRICDTRTTSPTNQCSGEQIGPNSTLIVQVNGISGLPSTGISAIMANLTVVNPTTTGGGFLTVYPTGATQPTVSNLNFSNNQTIPNRIMVPVSSTGQISIYNFNGISNVILDINGWFTDSTTSTGYKFSATAPVRICDTRGGSAINQCNTLGESALGPTSTLTIAVPGISGLPNITMAGVVANVTVTNTTSSSFLTIYPPGPTLPVSSDLNWVQGETIPNLVGVLLSSTGNLSIYNFSGYVDVIVDVQGWYS